MLGLLPLGHDLSLYYLVLVLVAFGFWLIARTVHSPFGQVLAAIRDSEARAVSLGYRVAHYKLAAYVLSAALAVAQACASLPQIGRLVQPVRFEADLRVTMQALGWRGGVTRLWRSSL